MAAAGSGYGEHKCGPSLLARLVLAFGVLLPIIFIWAMADDPSPSSNPTLVWISVGLLIAGVVAWIAIGKTQLTINDQGVRRESILGAQEWRGVRFRTRVIESFPSTSMHISV
jgi:hypothetical protein